MMEISEHKKIKGVGIDFHPLNDKKEVREFSSVSNKQRDKMKKFRISVLVKGNGALVSDFVSSHTSFVDSLERGDRWLLCRCQILLKEGWTQMFPLYYAPSVFEAKKEILKCTRSGAIVELVVGKRKMASAVYKNKEKVEVVFTNSVKLMSDKYTDIFNRLI